MVIHHNPDCSTSRNVLAIIEASGETPVVIEHLQTGLTCPQLLALFAVADLTPRTALRTTKSPAEALGLLDPSVDDATLLTAIARSDLAARGFRPDRSPPSRKPIPRVDPALVLVVGRIGGSLNQITRWLNRAMQVGRVDLDALMAGGT